MSSLLEMPDVVMKQILDECGFVAVQHLRKTCHSLRNFIDNSPPDFLISRIVIYVEPREICLMIFSNTGATLKTIYRTSSNGTIVRNGNPDKEYQKLLKNMDILNVFCQDFELLLRGQKSIIEVFRMSFAHYNGYGFDEDLHFSREEFFGKLKNILSKKLSLKVENLDLSVPNQENIMAILPFLDGGSIKSLQFWDATGTVGHKLDIENIIVLPHWKSASELSIGRFAVSAPIQNFFHFESASIYMETISNEDIMLLKNNILSSPSFSQLKINLTVQNIEAQEFFTEKYGEPYLDNRYQSKTTLWFFKRDKETMLKFLIHSARVVFEKIEKESVPSGVLVLE